MKYSSISAEISIDIHLKDVSYKIFIPSREDAISRVLQSTKLPYEYEMLEEMLKRLQPEDTCLDIGANIGNHSLFLAAHGIRCICFEANEDLCLLLKKSIEVNGFSDLITVHNIALGAVPSTASLPEQAPGNVGGWHLVSGTDIRVIPLDSMDFSEKIRAVKMDVERYEPYVFQGAVKTFRTHLPDIYCEINLGDMAHIYKMLNSLKDLGYVCDAHWQHLNNYLFVPYHGKTEQDLLLKNIMYNQLFEGMKLKYLQETVNKLQYKYDTANSKLTRAVQAFMG